MNLKDTEVKTQSRFKKCNKNIKNTFYKLTNQKVKNAILNNN